MCMCMCMCMCVFIVAHVRTRSRVYACALHVFPLHALCMKEYTSLASTLHTHVGSDNIILSYIILAYLRVHVSACRVRVCACAYSHTCARARTRRAFALISTACPSHAPRMKECTSLASTFYIPHSTFHIPHSTFHMHTHTHRPIRVCTYALFRICICS